MKTLSDVQFSVLDLSPIRKGGTAAESFRNTLDLAKHAERWGYQRYWLAEHHGIPGVASAATAVVIGQVAAVTSRIRVGSGGIMLPNHAPLIIAEPFGTLASFFPGRIDLGIGRAPGGDRRTARALRRHFGSADTLEQDLEELRGYFLPGGPGHGVHAVPGEGLDVPVWLLGSSDFSARLAARLGLPFAFASHFAPDFLYQAVALYRHEFEPCGVLDRPLVMVGVNAVAADTDEEARRLFTSVQQAFLNLVRGTPGLLPPPVESMDGLWSPAEQAQVERMTAVSAVGSPGAVRQALEAVVESTGADELILAGQLYDHAARLRSFELVAGERGSSPLAVPCAAADNPPGPRARARRPKMKAYTFGGGRLTPGIDVTDDPKLRQIVFLGDSAENRTLEKIPLDRNNPPAVLKRRIVDATPVNRGSSGLVLERGGPSDKSVQLKAVTRCGTTNTIRGKPLVVARGHAFAYFSNVATWDFTLVVLHPGDALRAVDALGAGNVLVCHNDGTLDCLTVEDYEQAMAVLASGEHECPPGGSTALAD